MTNQRRYLRWLLASVVTLSAFGSLLYVLSQALYLDQQTLPSPLIGRPMPTLQLPQLGDPSSPLSSEQIDTPFDVKQLRGRRWVLNVWASWCPSCVEEKPLLQKLRADDDLILVGLNYKDDPQIARQWLLDHGNPYHYILQDQDGQAGITLGVYGVPETYLINGKGVVLDKVVGALTEDIVRQRLNATPITPDGT